MKKFKKGRIVTGTSAGAVVISDLMIYGEQRRENGKYIGKKLALRAVLAFPLS